MSSSLEEKSLNSFRISLLLTLLKTVVLFSVLTAFLSLLDFFPLELEYTYVVVAYALGMFFLTLLLIQNEKFYYYVLHFAMLFSLLTIGSMSLHLVDDEFRFVWFFLIAFSAFILGGKLYGFMITLIISFMVMGFYFLQMFIFLCLLWLLFIRLFLFLPFLLTTF